jgi:hypothetical protein
MTRDSETNGSAAVVVVDVLADVVVGDAVVDVVAGDAVVVVDGMGVVDEVVAADVTIAVGAGALVADDDASDPDEHASITCDATKSTHHRGRIVIVIEVISSA